MHRFLNVKVNSKFYRSSTIPCEVAAGGGINCVSPVMDDRLAFGVQDVPSEAIAIYP